MQIIYPMFERNRILKKEQISAIRDYAFAQLQLEYQEYEDGILLGCKLEVQNGEVVVGPGLIKCGQFICPITEIQRIEYKPEDQLQYLKLCVKIEKYPPDYIIYDTGLVLAKDGTLDENEFELCRFHLRRGAQLRCQYTGFTDLETEYDTVNQIYASWSGPDGTSLAPVITKIFGESILSNQDSLPEDHAFAYLCLSHKGALPVRALSGYILQKTGEAVNADMSKLDIFHTLCRITREVDRGPRSVSGKSRVHHTIYVD